MAFCLASRGRTLFLNFNVSADHHGSQQEKESFEDR